jgi:hypothetical protein
MDQINIDPNSSTGDNLITGNAATGDLSGMGPVFYGGTTYEVKHLDL